MQSDVCPIWPIERIAFEDVDSYAYGSLVANVVESVIVGIVERRQIGDGASF